MKAAESAGITIPEVSDFDSPTAKGALGTVEGHRVVLGSAGFSFSHGMDSSSLAGQADELRADGATAIFMGVDATVAGVFAIANPIKDTAAAALAALRAEGSRW